MPYQFYLFFSRCLVRLNLFLGLIYLLTFFLLFAQLSLYPDKPIYIQTINGFLFPVKPAQEPSQARVPVFEIK